MKTRNIVKAAIALGLAVSLVGCTGDGADDESADASASAVADDDGGAAGGDDAAGDGESATDADADADGGTGDGSDSGDGTGSDQSASEECGVLDAATIESLAGTALESAVAAGEAGRFRCTWGDTSKTAVHAFQTPASGWVASELPELVAQLGQVPQKLSAGVKEIRSGNTPEDAEACELTDLFMKAAAYEVGDDGGTLRATSGVSIMGLSCTNGTLSSVHVIRADKKVPEDASGAVQAALANLNAAAS